MIMMIRYLRHICLIAIPAVIVFWCFWPYRKRALAAMRLHSPLRREIGLTLLVAAIFAILALTLWPTYLWERSPGMWGDLLILIGRPAWYYKLSLMPFDVFRDYCEDILLPAYVVPTLVNFFGNLAVFMPMGFLPSLLFHGASWKRAVCIGFGMSFFIEAAQYFIMRNTAVDDIILNTLGALAGYGMYVLLRRFWPGLVDSFLCREISRPAEKVDGAT